MKFLRNAMPDELLFSGWNCVPYVLAFLKNVGISAPSYSVVPMVMSSAGFPR